MALKWILLTLVTCAPVTTLRLSLWIIRFRNALYVCSLDPHLIVACVWPYPAQLSCYIMLLWQQDICTECCTVDLIICVYYSKIHMAEFLKLKHWLFLKKYHKIFVYKLIASGKYIINVKKVIIILQYQL